MTLTIDDVAEALAANADGREASMRWLRKQGVKFTNGDFRHLADMVQNGEANEVSERAELYGELDAPDKRRPRATGKTFVFTCAQNNTKLHEGFWNSLMHYVEHVGAELHVSRFVYNKGAFAAQDAKDGTTKASDGRDVWYDPRIEQYASDEALQITDDLVWCGELNIIPTRVHPLSTLKTYTRGASGIVPHVKMRMDSVPTMRDESPVFMYTTGTVTQRNYIQRVAGQVAEFHHVFGALVVEVENDGTWYCRQINADRDGNFYDLDCLWSPDGLVEDSQRVLAITHGDLHGMKIDMKVFAAVFSTGGVIDQLLPKEQHFHDTIDFMPRNHHNIKDPHFLWEMHEECTANVEKEFEVAAQLLQKAYRDWCKSVVVVSNHDQAIVAWLKNTAVFYDPENVGFWLRMNLYVHDFLRLGMRPAPFVDALCRKLDAIGLHAGKMPKFVPEDVSHKIGNTDIEAGMHGHLGPNGARGNPLNLRTVGKANTAHTHSAGIVDGIYTAGVYGKLDMGYNKGLSSWSHSFIVTYPNGKRAIFTLKQAASGLKAWRDQKGTINV